VSFERALRALNDMKADGVVRAKRRIRAAVLRESGKVDEARLPELARRFKIRL
jgi:hypothetical protein